MSSVSGYIKMLSNFVKSHILFGSTKLGPMKYPRPICLRIRLHDCLFPCSEIFSGAASRDLLTFYMKLGFHLT